MEDKWFPTSPECLTSLNNQCVERLNPRDFSELFILYACLSGLCLFLCLVRYIKRYQDNAITLVVRNFNSWMIMFAQYNGREKNRNSQISQISLVPCCIYKCSTTRWLDSEKLGTIHPSYHYKVKVCYISVWIPYNLFWKICQSRCLIWKIISYIRLILYLLFV